ncbi:hypothetical protein D9757_000453 [Collybiopsis confluens]|uniref:CFEM domain-containing protein n=1 Tax=Collybiopsis confluens TaxID=2823264 RepID=A0A8H5I1K1_9AGAR|nr:hypothetical protein D9757_000453 [Collybiopsis confluens]
MKFTSTLISLALFTAIGVNAQSSASTTDSASTATPSLSSCALQCVSNGATAGGCSSATDLACLCTNTQAQQSISDCLTSQCPSDAAAVISLQTSECASVSGSSGNASIPASTAASSAASAAASTNGTMVGSTSGTATSSRASSTAPSSSGSSASPSATSKGNGAEKIASVGSAGFTAAGALLVAMLF